MVECNIDGYTSLLDHYKLIMGFVHDIDIVDKIVMVIEELNCAISSSNSLLERLRK